MQLSAVILAAGSGTRIGIPKLKLKHDNKYFINIILRNLKSEGIEEIVCVIRNDDLEWFKENVVVSDCIINDYPERGMVSSVKLGVERYKQKEGILLFPVDHPFVSCNTIKLLINDFRENKHSVIKPYYNHKSGHPLIVPRMLYNEIVKNGSNKSLNDIIRESGINVIRTDVKDDGILRNVNFPDDLSNSNEK